MSRTIASIVAVLGLIGGLWVFVDRADGPDGAIGRDASGGTASASTKLLTPSRAADSLSSTLAQRTRDINVTKSEIARRYETSTDYRGLYDELVTSQDAEASFFAWKILRQCMDVSRSGLTAVVRKFEKEAAAGAASLAGQRVDAFRRMKMPCAGFEGLRYTLDDLAKLRRKGVSRGDPRAIALTLSAHELDVTDLVADPIATAASLLATNDPFVFVQLQPFLTSDKGGGWSLDGRPIASYDAAVYPLAWAMIACDYGLDCGPTSELVLVGCALNSFCGPASFEELVRLGYAGNDAEYQRALGLRSRIFEALRRNDYASFGLSSRKHSPSR